MMVVATVEHARALRDALASRGYDLFDLGATGLYREMDVWSTLARVLDAHGAPDVEAFHALVGAPVLSAAARFGGVAVFGEMTSVLCSMCRSEAALRLEHLWGDLRSRGRIDLLCAFRLGDFLHDECNLLFEQLCSAHIDGCVHAQRATR